MNAPSSRFFKFSLRIESGHQDYLLDSSQFHSADTPQDVCSESAMS